MNITIISTSDNIGGAAIATYRLFLGLTQLDQNPVMAVKYKSTDNPAVYKVRLEAPEYHLEHQVFKYIQEFGIDHNRSSLSNTLFSLPYPGYDLSQTQIIDNAEIINLHWVAQFQSVESIANLLNTGKTVVWTLHDENPFTGGCHYAAGCEGFITDCSNCPQLSNNQFNIPFNNLKNKIRLWNSNLTIVTPSQWLADCARRSSIFKDLRIEVIPNSIDTEQFCPINKEQAKKKLGLDKHTFILLFGAITGHEKRKGLSQLFQTMNFCLQDDSFKKHVFNSKIKILIVGPLKEKLEQLDIEVDCIGYVDINDTDKLSIIYSAADLFVLPSLEDNLPNTMLEAMACGTPVVGFQVGGIPDLVEDGITGFTAPQFDCRRLGELILKIFFNKKLREQMNINCRQLMEDKFKLNHQAQAYLKLFTDLTHHKSLTQCNNSGDYLSPINEEIILGNWESPIHKEFLNAYRKYTLEFVREKNTEIMRIYKSYTYRTGNFFLYPLKKALHILRKIRKHIRHIFH